MNFLKAFLNALNCSCSLWKKAWLCIVLLPAFTNLNAQDFTVVAVATTETCPGNATLTLSVQNASPNGSVNYTVYKLPNTTNPIFDSSGTTVTNLHDGVYYIVATQVINGSPVEDTVQVTIEDETEPLTYLAQSVNAMCGPDGTIIVTINTGNAVSYEIIDGPVTRPPQASNIFNNLPTGQYSVRVTDNCGNGIVQGELVGSDANVLAISPPIFPDTELPACDLITIAHDITLEFPNIPAPVPLSITITLYPPDGSGPIVYNQTLTGLADGPDFTQIVPFYHDDVPYYYDLEIVDDCGTVYSIQNNVINQQFLGIGFVGDAGCPGKYIEISLVKYVAPYTVTFNSFPAEFDPMMNPLHPGPFYDPVTGYGSEADDIAVPYGNYNITVTDACGRSSTFIINVEETEVEPTISTFPVDCLTALGGVEVIVTGFETVEAYITEAPEEYPNELEDDVSEYINDEHNLYMEALLPPGHYEVRVIDECGREFVREFDINQGEVQTINANVRVDCTPGFGSARIFSGGGPVTQVTLTQAPEAFMPASDLPYDVSYNISAEDGIWYMNNLPPGTYKWLVDDGCYTDFEVTRTISGYSTSVNELSITRHCGSFDLLFNHTTTSSVFLYFGLQVELAPGIWGDPETGTVYEGDVSVEDSSYEIEPNLLYPNLTYLGKFRIVKYYMAYGTGNDDDDYPDQVECIEIVQDNFDFFDDLQLISIVNLTCSGDVADVQVTAQGAEPINYSIVSKNGEPFVIDNGNNNLFTGLESAEYVLYFEDPCGNFITQPFNIADLPPLVTATTPANIEGCDEANDGTETFDLSLQNAAILNGQDPATCTVTYHTTPADAETGANPLALSHTTGTCTIYARVLNSDNSACHAVTSFDITLKPTPELNMQDSYSMCEGENVYIYAEPGYTTYLWNGEPGDDFIEVSEAGTYTVTVTDDEGCQTTRTVTVTTSGAPTIASIEIEDWNETSNTITVIVEESPSQAYFEYSVDGINYQASNVFTGLTPGPYNVYVRDIYDCGMDEGEVYLLTYPKFFTPNGDGINDLWRIQFSNMEPDMLIYIYDRYGKIVSSFDAVYEGWDGTLNGHRLPATDYWFVVKRQNGKEYKGHFSMMR